MMFSRTTWTTWMLALAELAPAAAKLVSSVGGNEACPTARKPSLRTSKAKDTCSKEITKMPTQVFLKCAESQPEEVAFHFQLGKIDLKLERFEAAENHMDRAASLEPQNTWVRYHRGLARLAQGNGEGAEEDWTPLCRRGQGFGGAPGMRGPLLSEGHIMPTLNLLDNYEDEVGKTKTCAPKPCAWSSKPPTPRAWDSSFKPPKDFPESDIFQLQWARYLAVDDLDASPNRADRLGPTRRPNWGRVSFEWAESDPQGQP